MYCENVQEEIYTVPDYDLGVPRLMKVWSLSDGATLYFACTLLNIFY